jgi:hypothetical protein
MLSKIYRVLRGTSMHKPFLLLIIAYGFCCGPVKAAVELPSATYTELTDIQINAYIENGEKLAEYYTSEAFLEAVLEPEKVAERGWLTYHNTCMWRNTNAPKLMLPLGLYYGDGVYLALISSAWATEYFLFTALHRAFVACYTKHLIEQRHTLIEQFNQQDGSHHFVTTALRQRTWQLYKPTMPMLRVIGLYAVMQQTLTRAMDTTYIHSWISTNHLAAGSPMPMSKIMPLDKNIIKMLEPQAWKRTVHTALDYFDQIPAWQQSTLFTMTKEFTVLAAWLQWYEQSEIMPRWKHHLELLAPTFYQLLSYYETCLHDNNKDDAQRALVIIENYVHRILSGGFGPWMVAKTLKVNVVDGAVTGIIALPTIIKTLQYGYELYKTSNANA